MSLVSPIEKLRQKIKLPLDDWLLRKNVRLFLVFAANTALILLGVALTNFLLYYDFSMGTPHVAKRTAYYLVLSQLACVYGFRLHRGLWKYSSINDLILIFKVCLISAAANYLYAQYNGFYPVESLRFIITNHMWFIFNFGGFRLVARFYANLEAPREGEKRVVIIGAGDAGEWVCRHLLVQKHPYRIVGFLDDDPDKRGRVIHGYKVLGTIADLPFVVETKLVEEILVAIPSASTSELRQIVRVCAKAKLPIKILPRLSRMLSDDASFELKSLNIEDLLAREPVHIDMAGLSHSYRGKRVLVTGAAGSIGEELVHQIALLEADTVYLLDQAESPLYFLYRDCRERFPQVNFVPILCDITDDTALKHAFKTSRPQIVMHAAAYKHVPILEDNVYQALMVNVKGTRELARLAREYEAERFVFISTDKAVNPVNVLGASKRMAELMCQSFQDESPTTKFLIVRFGNVLGSQGSVIPLFKKQIENGGPVTVTHPDIQRFFMTIPEAVQLVLMASVLGNGGEIFVLDMGVQVKILDLALNMIRLSGFIPEKDVKIEYTGLRPGEKLYEELYDTTETIEQTAHPKINRAIGHRRPRAELDWQIDRCLDLAAQGATHDAVIKQIQVMVETYQPDADSTKMPLNVVAMPLEPRAARAQQ